MVTQLVCYCPMGHEIFEIIFSINRNYLFFYQTEISKLTGNFPKSGPLFNREKNDSNKSVSLILKNLQGGLLDNTSTEFDKQAAFPLWHFQVLDKVLNIPTRNIIY